MEFKHEPFDRAYELVDEIGSGQFAVVSLCRSKSTNEKFAAKCIYKSGVLTSASASPGVPIEAIRDEVSILADLKHDHIVQLFEVFESRNTVTLVLEYVEGGELFAILADKDRLDEEEASSFVRQLLIGVAYLHERLVVHLDLKPENIMLEQTGSPIRDPRVKIIDFGLAHRCKPNSTISVEPHGTPEFISPEVLACEPVSLSADMWTIGVIVHVILVGSSPFAAPNDAAIFRKILAAQYASENENGISDLVRGLLKSLLQRDPAKRLTAQQALHHAWVSPPNEEYSIERKRSVITRENLQKLKKYVGAKQRWKKTVELITVCNHLSQMAASFKRCNSFSELDRIGQPESGNASSIKIPVIRLVSDSGAASAPASQQSTSGAGVMSPDGVKTLTGGKVGGVRQLKTVTAATRTLSGAGIPSTSQQRAATNSNNNNNIAHLRSLLKPIAKTNKYN